MANLTNILMQTVIEFNTAISDPNLFDRITPLSTPVPFFGRLHSLTKDAIITVGINPSGNEFNGSTQRLYMRTQAEDKIHILEISEWFNWMYSYFKREDGSNIGGNWYEGWFGNFEIFLNHLGYSYFKENMGCSIHLDLISHLSTVPSWGRLDDNDKYKIKKISESSRMLFLELVNYNPCFVLIGPSVKSEFDMLIKSSDFKITYHSRIDEENFFSLFVPKESLGDGSHFFEYLEYENEKNHFNVFYINKYNTRPFNEALQRREEYIRISAEILKNNLDHYKPPASLPDQLNKLFKKR